VLRSAPGSKAEIVFRAPRGTVLISRGTTVGDWLQVSAPGAVRVWVYGELVRDGKVAASRLLGRAGPGIKHAPVCEFRQGDVVRADEEKDGWLRTAPAGGCALWIVRSSVMPADATRVPSSMPPAREPVEPVPVVRRSPAAGARTTVHAVGARAPAAAARTAGAAREAPLAADQLVDSREQGVKVSYEGKLRPSGIVWNRPSRYRLVTYDEHGWAITICYVLADEEKLARLEDEDVTVDGQEYWVQGVKYSVVVPHRIARRARTL
jgi:hypothetical protein